MQGWGVCASWFKMVARLGAGLCMLLSLKHRCEGPPFSPQQDRRSWLRGLFLTHAARENLGEQKMLFSFAFLSHNLFVECFVSSPFRCIPLRSGIIVETFLSLAL
jgi:hypothetical protein